MNRGYGMLPVNTQNALGIDIGSTTTKIVLVRSGQIVYEKYERHLSRVREKTLELIEEIRPLLEAVPPPRRRARPSRTGRR